MMAADMRAATLGLVLATTGGGALSAQETVSFDSGNRVTVGDWAVECLTVSNPAPDQCQLYQRILTQDPNTVALIAALAWSQSDKALLAQISLPLGSDLTSPPSLNINGEAVASFAWSRCLSTGCLIEAPLPEPLVAALLRGENATFTVVQPNAGPIAIPLSLVGFEEGLGEIMPEGIMPAMAAEEEE